MEPLGQKRGNPLHFTINLLRSKRSILRLENNAKRDALLVCPFLPGVLVNEIDVLNKRMIGLLDRFDDIADTDVGTDKYRDIAHHRRVLW